MRRIEQKIKTGNLAANIYGEGRPLVLLHGFPLNRQMWSEIAPRIAGEENWQVITPDLPGFGESTFTGETPSEYTMANFAEDIREFLGQLGISEKIVLGGLSMGGYIAMEYVRTFGETLAGLVLTNTRTAADTPEAAANRHQLAETLNEELREKMAADNPPKLLSEKSLAQKPELAEFVEKMVTTTPIATIAAAARGMAARKDTTGLLATVKCPALVVAGCEDALVPVAEMEALASKLPDCQFCSLPEVAHLAPLEAPEDFVQELLPFLAQC